jgi:hypothetical protein
MSPAILRVNNCVALFPKPIGNFERLEFEVYPPDHLIAGVVQLPMMTTAEGNSELVADFEPDSSGLGKTKVMRITGLFASRMPSALHDAVTRMRDRGEGRAGS